MKIGMVVPQRVTLEETLAGFEVGERLGVQRLWFSQPVGGFDALTTVSLAAARVAAVQLGTAVVPTFPSHPVVTARMVRTAVATSQGRVVLGVGAGHRMWIERQYGQRFAQPVRQVTDWIAMVRRLLAGEEVAAGDNIFGIAAPAVEPAPSNRAPVPIVVAATGPKMLAAGGRVGDGILTWMCDETYLGEVVIPCVARGAAAAQRGVPPVSVGVLICVSDDAARTRRKLVPQLAPLADYESYQRTLARGGHPARTPADTAVIGTEDQIVHAFGRLAAAGASEAVAVVVPDPSDPAGSVHRAHRLLARLAAAQGLSDARRRPWEDHTR